jgi:hypothetical protein
MQKKKDRVANEGKKTPAKELQFHANNQDCTE